jgi:hypothetical protein
MKYMVRADRRTDKTTKYRFIRYLRYGIMNSWIN